MQQRRICWPNPDATCLEGGCGHCNSYPFRNVTTIYNYCERVEVLNDRNGGTTRAALEAYKYGELRNWNNAEVRTV